jgi:predicted dehydrogenase
MNQNENIAPDFNRRDFLKTGSVATVMAMMGGVELFAEPNAAPAAADSGGTKLKIGVIGLGAWGREILNTLATIPRAEVAAICDSYPAAFKRASTAAPKAATSEDYRTVVANKDINAVVVATPTHQHKEIVLAALKAGKHVYCEAPLASSIEDAREIALAAKPLAMKQIIFQVGLQNRSDKERMFLRPFIRSGALGETVMARAQWHKKQSWRSTSPNPEREQALNWRVNKATSLGLVGEVGVHHLDQACWFLNALPIAASGFGSIALWKDGRDVPDTIQLLLEYPGGVFMNYDATLANTFDGEYELLFGSDSAVMIRESKAWLFKEVDSKNLGWEVYAKKESLYQNTGIEHQETGIVLRADASKSSSNEPAKKPEPYTETPLWFSLFNFVYNSADLSGKIEATKAAYGDDADTLASEVAQLVKVLRPAAGYLEGYQSAVTVIKANEAITSGKRLEFKHEWYELA